METLEEVAAAAASSAVKTVASFDSVKTEITMLMEVINGIPEFDGHSIDLQEFSFLMMAAHAQLAAASNMLGDVRVRNLYNMLVRRVSMGVRADVGITFHTPAQEMLNKLKARYAGARRPVARTALKVFRMRRDGGETPQQFAHRLDASLRTLKERAVEEYGAAEAAPKIAVYEEITREVLMAEMPDKIRRQLRDGTQRSLEAALVVVDDDEDEVRAARTSKVYKMSSKPKGLVFILDNRFPLEGELPTMLKEREHVKSLFLGLDFEVISYENLTANELTEKVTNFAQLEKHSKLDCCAVFVMADGFDDRESYKGILMSTSDRKLISTEWIVSQFTDIKCPHLKKKPKLFFFQSTRSLYLEDYTRVIMEAKEPVSKDTIIVSASYADITNGNGFAHIICDVFMKKAYNTDIRTMLHDVSKMMKKIYYEYTGPVQLRIMTVGFDKKLYFNPGLFDK